MRSMTFHASFTRFLNHAVASMHARSRNAILAIVLLALTACSSEEITNAGSAATLGGDFTLESAAGTVSLHDYQGRVVLLFFGYTHCPDICPATLDHIAAAFDLLGSAELRRVQGLFITIDPVRDSAGHLAEYVGFFHRNITGLAGDPDRIREVARRYQVEYHRGEARPDGGYSMTHTSRLYILDTDGRVVDMMGHKTRPEDIAVRIRSLL